MRLLMMGTGPFAEPSFRALAASDHEMLGLIAQPIRSRTGQPSPMRDAAENLGLPIWDFESINQPHAHQLLRELAADLFVVCDYGQILSDETLSLAPKGGINLHGSLLPKYRGAAPVNWALYHGDEETGVTVIHMTPRLDGGPILAVVKTPIDPQETALELEPRLAQLGAPAVVSAVERLAEWDGESPIGEPQDPALVSRAPRLKKSDGRIDWTRTAREIVNQIRAFQPWPGAFCEGEDRRGKPLRLIVEQAVAAPRSTTAEPGQVLSAEDDTLEVAAGDHSSLRIEKLKPAGKRTMTATEFLRGRGLAASGSLK